MIASGGYEGRVCLKSWEFFFVIFHSILRCLLAFNELTTHRGRLRPRPRVAYSLVDACAALSAPVEAFRLRAPETGLHSPEGKGRCSKSVYKPESRAYSHLIA